MEQLFGLLALLFSLSCTLAAKVQLNSIVEEIKYALTPGTVIFSVLCFVLGPFLLFFGFRFFKPVIFLSGFLAGGLLGYAFISNLEDVIPSLVQHRDLVCILVSIILGIVFGVLMLWAWKFSVIILGCLGGFAFAMFLLAWKTGGLITNHIGRPVFIAIFTIAFGVLVFLYDKPVVILATSLIGSLMIGAAIDCYAEAGLTLSIRSFITNRGLVEIGSKGCWLLAGVLLMCIVGIVVQFFGTGRIRKSFFSEGDSSKKRTRFFV